MRQIMAAAQDTLYLKIDRNIVVWDYQVHLQDIAKMECTDAAVLRQLKQKKIYTFQQQNQPGRKNHRIQVFSILSIIQKVHEDYPKLEVQNMGETDFIVECRAGTQQKKWLDALKTAVLCVVLFFGSAFTIMAFNNDISVGEVFSSLYQQIMGVEADGVTELEICYALGMPVGIMVFYNHIGRKKITPDPTPIQVEMRKYEQDIDTAFIENAGRAGKNIDVEREENVCG